MTAAWPAELPKPNRQGFQVNRGEARMRRRAENGPGGMRRRTSAVIDTMAMTLELSAFQLGVFDTFFDETTRRGSLPFTMPDPIRDGWPLLDNDGVQITDEGVGLLISKTILCQFSDQLPATTVIGVHFRVSFSVDILP